MAKTLLLIDDDADDTELFYEALKEIDASIDFYCASDCKEALRKLDNKEINNPNLIFLDVNMTGMNGWECLDKLKLNKAHRDIPVIMYSTSIRNNYSKAALDSGALCFFSKPYDCTLLKKMLQIVITNIHNNTIDSICNSVNNLK